jgi:hydroxymethylpyrimidine pyrophosphatase-like HAD family hydrolase
MSLDKVKLLAVDFDGTLYRYGNEMPLYAAFAAQIHPFRERGGVWVVCSGRTRASLKQASRGMGRAGLEPDYLIVSHWIVYARDGGLWLPRPLLSLRIRRRQRHEAAHLADLINSQVLLLRERYPEARFASTLARYFRVQFDTEAEARAAFATLRGPESLTPDDLLFAWNRCEMEVRGRPFEKGVALKTLCQTLGIRAVEVLAIGDGRSDLAMLSAEASGLVGCPGNSKPEVAELVSHRGGHVSRKSSLAGVIDVLDAFASGRPDNSLPSNWNPPQSELGSGSLSSPHEQYGYGTWMNELVMIIAAGVITLIVLATFGVIPFGPLLMWPLVKLFDLLGRFLT